MACYLEQVIAATNLVFYAQKVVEKLPKLLDGAKGIQLKRRAASIMSVAKLKIAACSRTNILDVVLPVLVAGTTLELSWIIEPQRPSLF